MGGKKNKDVWRDGYTGHVARPCVVINYKVQKESRFAENEELENYSSCEVGSERVKERRRNGGCLLGWEYRPVVK